MAIEILENEPCYFVIIPAGESFHGHPGPMVLTVPTRPTNDDDDVAKANEIRRLIAGGKTKYTVGVTPEMVMADQRRRPFLKPPESVEPAETTPPPEKPLPASAPQPPASKKKK